MNNFIGFNILIIESEEKYQRVKNLKDEMNYLSIEEILDYLNYKREDFTDLDWNNMMNL